ncbi:transmembrane protein -like [Brachionus plicatilis]|uniref:Transmembrane protein 208 n=1 Tax=Brachionus plicatilis TaxID=10195 RepID=A0A3M7QHQ9_BRAPC|nr:transmembrane protein -like [Brachionus plicatilis]
MNKTTKGKQGTRGTKQIIEENRQTVDFYFNVFTISNVAYLIIRYLLFWDTFSAKFILLYTLTAFTSLVAYYFISYVGKPILDEKGIAVDYSSDLNMSGHVSEYAKDVILFSVIQYILSLISNYFWFALIILPLYVFVKIWQNFLGPWFFEPAPEEEPQDQKKQKTKTKVIRR